MAEPIAHETRARAARSGGSSGNAVYEMVARALDRRNISGATALDLGCGAGALRAVLEARFKTYIGVDAVRYDSFPASARFIEVDLNAATFPVESASADFVVATETIEHLENPRALLREMKRIARPGGWLIVTTPNQLSFLSRGTLLFKAQFSAFQDVHYPAHITALLECDLRRIASELGLRDVAIEYSLEGRIVLTPLKYPRLLSRAFPRICSDNVLLIGRAP
jgi:2-polyprenyl-3-methyl-5-hydroxy-6-metoxy-1,4-benzoquinol methylase